MPPGSYPGPNELGDLCGAAAGGAESEVVVAFRPGRSAFPLLWLSCVGSGSGCGSAAPAQTQPVTGDDAAHHLRGTAADGLPEALTPEQLHPGGSKQGVGAPEVQRGPGDLLADNGMGDLVGYSSLFSFVKYAGLI